MALLVIGWPSGSAPTQVRNVVVIITDDQNVDSLPVMRKLMNYPEGSWINFTNAFVNDSICCPARASLLTGQYSHTTGVVDNGSGNRLKDENTLPVWLDQAGFRTGLIGKYLNGYPWDKGMGYVPPGWDYFQATGSGNVDAKTMLAVRFLNTTTSPFFLYLAYSDPHRPARPVARYANADVFIPADPPNFNEADVSDKPTWIRSLRPLDQATIDAWHLERVASQRALLGVDDGIQQIVRTLKENNQLDNTMVIFLADHGFSWGSHRWIKKDCMYEECIRMPLLIRYPGSSTNREEARLVSNVDVAATITEYVGIAPGLPQDGRSFLSLLDNDATEWSEEVFLESHLGARRTFNGIRVPRWVYAEYRNGDKELYDLVNDPYQLQNQANNPVYQTKRHKLAERMRVLMGQ
jgi:N-acetylglucosamine-6-sulfatase